MDTKPKEPRVFTLWPTGSKGVYEALESRGLPLLDSEIEVIEKWAYDKALIACDLKASAMDRDILAIERISNEIARLETLNMNLETENARLQKELDEMTKLYQQSGEAHKHTWDALKEERENSRRYRKQIDEMRALQTEAERIKKIETLDPEDLFDIWVAQRPSYYTDEHKKSFIGGFRVAQGEE